MSTTTTTLEQWLVPASLAVAQTLSVGPLSVGQAEGRLETSGATAGLSFMNRSLTAWPPVPVAGDRFILYNQDRVARLKTENAGDLLKIDAAGNTSIAGELSWASSRLNRDQGGSIELGGAGTPYIDFHYNNPVQDFNVRMINDADGQLAIQARKLRVRGALVVEGPLDDNVARGILSGPPNYQVVFGVETRAQGTALVWYWKDGDGRIRKAWDQGTVI